MKPRRPRTKADQRAGMSSEDKVKLGLEAQRRALLLTRKEPIIPNVPGTKPTITGQ